MSGELGEWIHSSIGTSAGTVLGPILFIIFVEDAPWWCSPKFADDITGLAVEDSPGLVERKLNLFASEMATWAKTNGIPLNIPKTKVMLFGDTEYQLTVSLDGIYIEQVSEHKSLGVWIDSLLRFHHHTVQACGKSRRALMKVSPLLKGRFGLPIAIGVQVYVALIRSLLEYAAPAWCFAIRNHLPLMERMQYQALRSISGAFNGSSSAALEVICGIQPVDLRLKDLCVREWCRVKSMDFHHPLYVSLGVAAAIPPLNSPLSYLAHVSRKFNQHMEVNDLVIKQRLVITPEAILSQRRLNFINIFEGVDIGGANDRSPTDKIIACAAVSKFLSGFLSSSSAVVFSDGSVMDGNCGAAAISVDPNGSSSQLSRKIISQEDNVEAEVAGVVLAFELMVSMSSQFPDLSKGAVFCDCLSAIQIISLQRDFTRWGHLLTQIWRLDDQLKKKGVSVCLCWCPSHCGIPLNEAADKAAKEACSSSVARVPLGGRQVELSLEQCKSIIRDSISKEWQLRWANSSIGHYTKEIVPLISQKLPFPKGRSGGITMVRSLLNHGGVRHNLYRCRLVDSPDCPDCGAPRQTTAHVLLECKRYSPFRDRLLSQMPPSFSLSLGGLLNPNYGAPRRIKKVYLEAIHSFLEAIVL